MSADDSKNPDESTAKKKKDDVIRADMVGGLERDEESVVDWVDDEPTPTEPSTEATPEAPADVTADTSSPEPEPPSEPEPAAPPAPPPVEDADISKEKAPPEPPEKQSPPTAAELPKSKKEPSAPTQPVLAEPAKPAEAKRQDKVPKAKTTTVASTPAGDIQKHVRPVEPPAEPKTRKPMTSRILLWGGVLIIVAVTVRYFVSYEPDSPAPPTAETGLLFHKIEPVPASVARGPVPKPPKPVSAQPAPAPTAPEPQKVPAPVKKPVAQKAPVPPKTPATKKAAATKAKPVAQAKAYVPRKYPYAIHVASFQSVETAREKLTDYRRGFQAYLVRTDLGKKGIWYRLFLGHFPNATSALDAIKKYNLKGALVARNRFACLVGSYASTAEAETAAQQLIAKGYLPYTVAIDKVYHLFVGAHPTSEAARALLMDLAASGFSSNLIER